MRAGIEALRAMLVGDIADSPRHEGPLFTVVKRDKMFHSAHSQEDKTSHGRHCFVEAMDIVYT